MKFTLYFLFQLSLCWTIVAQSTILNFHQLTKEEGLSETTNDFLFVDKNRYTWIGSLDGVNRYDGKVVDVYKSNLKDSLAMRGVDVQSSFFEDKSGNIWFTTGEAINCYQSITGKFIHDFAGGYRENLGGVHYAFHLEDNQYLWLIANGALYKHNIKEIKPNYRTPFLADFNLPRAALSTNSQGVAEFIFGCHWTRSQGFEVVNVKDTCTYTWFQEEGYPASFTLRTPKVIPNIDSFHTACFLTDKGLLFFNPNTPLEYQLYEYPPNKNRFVDFIKVDNHFWLVNGTSEITQFDIALKTFSVTSLSSYNLDKKAFLDNINRIFLGRDSIVWVSNKEGLFYANRKNTDTPAIFLKNDLPPQSINDFIEKPDGSIIGVPTNGGLGYSFDETKKVSDRIKFSSAYKEIRLSNQQRWGKNYSELFKYNVDGSREVYRPTYEGYIIDIVSIDTTSIYLGTTSGLLLFSTLANKFEKIDALEGFIVKLFKDSKKRLWMATAAGQLVVLALNNSNQVDTILFSFANMGIINDIKEDTTRNQILIGSSKGLIQIKDTTSFPKTILTENDGLTNQYIKSIVLDRYSNIWLATNAGVERYCPDTTILNKFKLFSIRDGLSDNQYNRGAAYMSKSGELWFGSAKGIDVINPNLQIIGIPPSLMLKSLNINGREWVGEKPIDLMDKISLNYKENTLEFKLAGIEYTDSFRNNFKAYLSHNNQVDSNLIRNGNTIAYRYLSPGDYEFWFTACNAEGLWQKKHKKLLIKINPPFTQTLWFKMLLAILIITIVTAILSFYYRYQLRAKQLQIEKREALQSERNRIAKELHDQLGLGLSTISSKSASAVSKADSVDVQSGLTRIHQISVELMKNMREVIWTMDPTTDSLKKLMARIRLSTVKSLLDNEIAVEINLPREVPVITLTSQAKYHLLLVVKELIHNIVKHAQATEVLFNLHLSESLTIKIKDNGKGFDFVNQEERGYGLKNCVDRITTIGGQIKWDSIPTGGTVVSIEIPLSEISYSEAVL